MLNYISNPDSQIIGPRDFQLNADRVVNAVHRTRSIMDRLAQFEVDVFALLGMRNLSAFVGEVFAASMILELPDLLAKNPHQDGYPDLLLLDMDGTTAWDSLAERLREKGPFSPYLTGGFEVKATCGAVPTPAQCLKKGVTKPDIGDNRVAVLTGYDWKSHHRETNYLFGLFWDFIDSCPTVVAVFYSSSLTTDDWGNIVQPKEGGGRTTSVSIMTRQGISKMYEGWVVLLDDPSYASFFDKKNGGSLLTSVLSKDSLIQGTDFRYPT
jgi:hypothetical protein